MNHRTVVTALLLLLMAVGSAAGQNRSNATQPGAALIGGLASFTSQGGDLYGGFDDERSTTIALGPSAIFIVAPGIGIGGDLSYTRQSQGDESATVWGIGPKAAYFFDSGGNAIPFLAFGTNYLSIADEDNSEGGWRLKAVAGILMRKDHLAVSFEAAYLHDRFNFEGVDGSTTGNTIALGIGFAGLLYR